VGFWPCPRSDTSWIYCEEECLNCVCVHQANCFENKRSIIFTGLGLKEEHFPHLLFLCSVLEDQGEMERQILDCCRYADTA
jgi:hypothetical protein